MSLITALRQDDAGFIISAELVLISTVAVLGLIVGLSQVQNAAVSEMNDVAHALGSLNQSYYYSGFSAWKWGGRLKSRTFGSAFYDSLDACDGWGCAIACDGAVSECGTGFGGGDCGSGGAASIGTATGYSTGTVITGETTATCPIIESNEADCLPGIVTPVNPTEKGADSGYIPVKPQLPVPPAPEK